MKYDLDELFDQNYEWGCKTFPYATNRSRALHLLKEAEELVDNPEDAGEIADIAILLGHICKSSGMDLSEAIHDKMQINFARKWGPADKDGVSYHVKS